MTHRRLHATIAALTVLFTLALATPALAAALDNAAFFEGSEAFSPTQKFKTDSAPVEPTPTVNPATEVSYTTARISGLVNPEGGNQESGGGYVPIHWVLELRDATAEGSYEERSSGDITGPQASENFPPGEGIPVGPTELSGLIPGHTYNSALRLSYGGTETQDATAGTFKTLAVAKPTISEIAVSAISAESAHLSAEVEPGGTDPAFDTSWHFECTPSCGGLHSGTVPAGATGSELKVESPAEYLQPNTLYTVRLFASNAGGQVKQTETFQTAAAGPSVIPFQAGPVHATTADLNGQVNPRGASTVYWFQWGTENCETGSCTSVPAERDASAGNGTSAIYVTRHLTGLTPNTVYHFRLLAENASGTTEGPDSTFTTPATESGCANAGMLGTGVLPDCRAWELASPVDKNGGDVMPVTNRTRAAADGSAVNFTSLVSFAGPQGATIGSEYIAERTAAPGTQGWDTHGITPLQQPLPSLGAFFGDDPSYDGEMSPDLTQGVFRAYTPLTDVPDVAGQLNLYVRDDLRTPGPGSYRLISDPGFPVPTTPLPVRPFFAGASTDFSHLIFQSRLNLDPHATGGKTKLYEFGQGSLHLAGRIPPPGQIECDDAAADPCEAAPSSQAGRGAGGDPFPGVTPHMISADGSRIFFQAPAGSEGNLYMRVDGTRTAQLNASEKTTPESPQEARLWTASADGTRIFFSTSEGLVNEDQDGASDYYMYDTTAPPGHHLTLVSVDGEPAVNDSVSGIVGASNDGHYLYFLMAGQLVAGENPLVVGLYLWHDGAVRYIGDFAHQADPVLDQLEATWFVTELALMARVSPDGTHLIFETSSGDGFQGHGGFAGFDQDGACGGGCREIYVYSAASGRLRCASCNPTGAPPTGVVEVNAKPDAYASDVSNTSYLNHPLSADGRWVFFTSPDPLVPQDKNNKLDAYAYDTDTERVSLLSSGTSTEDSYFMDASASGRDAFFATKQRLSAWDTDASYDLYDARVGGGLPEPAAVPPPCHGDSCRPAPPGTPGTPLLASTQPGPGNPQLQSGPRHPKPRPCPKGKLRKHGRCVKKHPGRRHHPEKHRRAGSNRRAGK